MKQKDQQQEDLNNDGINGNGSGGNRPEESPREAGSHPEESYIDSPDQKAVKKEAQNKGFVTAYGRQLSGNHKLDLNFKKNGTNTQYRNGTKKNVENNNVHHKNISSVYSNKGLAATKPKGFVHQKTIPLNFLEDLKVGLGDSEKDLINFDGTSNGHGDQWFLENNFSVISREHQNPALDKIEANKALSDQKYFSSPEQMEVEYGLANAISPKRKRQAHHNVDNDNFSSEQNGQRLSNFHSQKRSVMSLDNKFWNQGNTEAKLLDRVNSDNELASNPLFYQSYNSIGTKMEYNTGNKGSELGNPKLQLNFFKNPNQGNPLNKSLGESPQSQNEIRQMLHFQLPNADLLSPPVQWKRNRKNVIKTAQVDTDEHNDESDVEKKLDVDFAAEQKLDEKRFGLGVISKLKAQISQNQVKDDNFFMIVEKNSLEKIDSMTGKCVKFRQAVMRLATNITHTASAIISSKPFDGISLAVIIANSVSLAMQDPTATTEQKGFALLDIGFLAFYTFEMIMKILGLGFILSSGSYLRDAWNILDFVIVTSSYLPYIITNSKVNLSSLRSFRVLRPLRTISGVPGLKVIVSSLLASMTLLKDTLILLVFFFLIFGIAGLQVFMGILKKQCFEIESGRYLDDGGLNFCGGSRECPSGYFCGKSSFNPQHNFLSFDNMLYSLLACFVTVTLESWTYIMKYLQRSLSFYVFGFSVPLAFLGSFVLQNLTMAVVSAKYKEEFAKKKNDQALNQRNKKKKILLDIDNLDEAERDKIIAEQEEARQQVLRKWQMILFVKQRMRTYIEEQRIRKLFEVKKMTQTGFDRLSMIESPAHAFKSKDGGLYDKETNYDPEASARQQLTMGRLDWDSSLRNPQQLTSDEKLKLTMQNGNKTNIFQLHKNDIINEDDDEYRTEFSNIHANSHNQKSHLKGSSPASPFLDKQKKFFNDLISEPHSKEIAPKFDRSGKKMIILDSPDKILRMHGMAGFKQNDVSGSDPNKSKLTNTDPNIVAVTSFDQEQFFLNFINSDLPDIEKQFTEIQLAQIAENLDIREYELFPLIEDDESNEISDNSIQSVEGGHERLYVSRRNVNKRKRSANKDHRAAGSHQNQPSRNSNINRQKSEELSTSGEILKLTSNVVAAKHTDNDLHHQSQNNDLANSNEYQLASSISDLTLRRGQSKLIKTESVKQVTKQSQDDESDIQKQSPTLPNDKKKMPQSNKWQNESTTLIIGANNGTVINDTQYTYQQSRTKGEDKAKASARVMPFGSGSSSSLRNIKLSGTNTILRRDVVPMEQSILNSKFLVEKEVGINKKIYLRNDKFDFEKPAEDIFEKREMQQAKINLENTIKEQTEYLRDWKIRPYQRRAEFQTIQLQPDEEQQEYLSAQGLDGSDLASMVQDRFDEPYLSNLYVTGTLSITILVKKGSIIEHRTRKLQNNNFAIVEYYDQQTSRSQSMNSSNISRKSTLKSSTSSSIGLSPVDIQKIIVMKSIRQPWISVTRSGGLQQQSMIAGNTTRQAIKERVQLNDPNEALTAAAQKKAKSLAKQAMKNQKFQQQLIIYRLNKDAMRSASFKLLIEKRKARAGKSQIIEDLDAHISEENEDEEQEEVEFQDTEDFKDDFLDRKFDNTLEIKKSKKQAVFKKRPLGLWSGQDVLEDFDPFISQSTAQKITDVRVWPYGPYGIFKSAQGYVRQFVRLGLFDNFLTMCVFTNVILLTLDKYPADPSMDAVLAVFNKVFTYIFISEMSLKIIGLGPVRYLKDKMNYLDGLVVILSIVEIIMSGKGSGGSLSAFKSIRIFRIFRILRIARLLRAMKSMSQILGVLMNSMASFIYLLLLMFLFLFIYTLLGMQLFGGNFNFSENDGAAPGPPRANYDSFHQAFQSVFDILTVESWFIQLYDGLRSGVVWPITILFLLSWIFLGNWMILNLFLAILLDGFSSDQTEEDPDESEQSKQEKAQKKLMEQLDQKEGEELILYYQDSRSSQKNQRKAGLNLKKKKKRKKNEVMLDESFEFEKENLKKRINQMKNKHKDFEGVECTYALYFLHRNSKLRIFLYKVQHHAVFEYIILLLIIVSSGKLIMDTYIYSNPKTDLIVVISDKMDYAFTALFFSESLIKSLALGFALDKGSYLREFWNQLDCFIVFTSLLDVALFTINTPALKVMKILRALRPLRFISHNRDMKTLVNTLAQSIGAILNVGVVLLIVWSMFAILGINLFSGKLFYCTAGDAPYEFLTEKECYMAGGQWTRYAGNFDNFMQALITLFTISTFENWPDILHSLEDINDTQLGPILNNNPINAYFLMAFILIGVFIFLNLFTGVLFMKFEQVQQEEKEATQLTDKQMKWIDIMKMIVNAKPDLETVHVPESQWRKKVHKFVTGELGQTNKFDLVIMGFIVANMILMTLDFETATVEYNNTLEKVNYIFTVVFVCEAILKLTAFGFAYFKSTWNVFDFTIVSTSLLDIVISNFSGSKISFLSKAPQIIRVLRVLRVSRLFRLVNKYRGLAALIQTLQFSMPQLINVFALVGLNYFIFAIVANFLFRDVSSGMIIDEITNFSNFGYSYLTLIRMSTGEDWNYIMYDCSQSSDTKCIPGVSCGSIAAYPFFIFYMLFQQNIILNLFVLVLCQQFDLYYLKTDNILARFKDDLETYKLTWTRQTYNQKCIKIKDTQMITFFNSMKKPLGFADKNTNMSKKEKENYITAKVVKMEIERDEHGYVYFNELLFKTMRRVYGQRRVKNSIIVQNELETMLKIEEIQDKFAKKSRIQEKQEIGSVNPFLLKMFMNISFKAWFKIYSDNMAINELEKQFTIKNDNESSQEQPATPNQDVESTPEDEFYYKTEEDLPYYAPGEEASGSEYDDEDDYDDESDSQQNDELANNGEILPENGNAGRIGNLIRINLNTPIKGESPQIMTERAIEQPTRDQVGLSQAFKIKPRKNSDDEFKRIRQQVLSKEKQGVVIEKSKTKKRRKTVFVPGSKGNVEESELDSSLKKDTTMRLSKKKTQKAKKLATIGGSKKASPEQPRILSPKGKKEATNMNLHSKPAEKYVALQDEQSSSLNNDESANVSSNMRLREAEIVSIDKVAIRRSRTNSLENQSQDQIDENSQLVEEDEKDQQQPKEFNMKKILDSEDDLPK